MTSRDPTSRSTGAAPNDAYLWGGDVDTNPDATYVYTSKYQKPNFLSDDVGTALSVHKLGELSEWANTALVYHTAPVYVCELYTQAVNVTTTAYTTVYGPIWVPLYFGRFRQLDVRALVRNGAAETSTIRFVTSRSLPSGTGFTSPTYVDVDALTTSTNWAAVPVTGATDYTWVTSTLTPSIALKNGQAGCYFTIDIATDASLVTTELWGAYVAELPSEHAGAIDTVPHQPREPRCE